jgi:signal peptidase I
MRKMFLIIGALLLIEIAIYTLNPFHTASHDPRHRLWGISPFSMRAASMEPTIRAGTMILVSSWPYLRHAPRAGDLVAFRYPADPSVIYLKRLIATGGSTLEISHGVLRVDGRVIPEPYVPSSEMTKDSSRELPVTHVPPDNCFVMGDNRDNSSDSRFYGFIPLANIVGKVVLHRP